MSLASFVIHLQLPMRPKALWVRHTGCGLLFACKWVWNTCTGLRVGFMGALCFM